MSEDICKAWQGGCKDAYAAGWTDLVRLLAHADECCPPEVECWPEQDKTCTECWTEYIQGLT